MRRLNSWRSNCSILWKDQAGLVLSAELIIIVTVVVLGLITGLACLQQAVVAELQDVGFAVRGMNQSYATPSFFGCRKFWGRTSWTAGSRFTDVGHVGGSAGFAEAEIGTGRRDSIIEPGPTRVMEPEGCITCPPTAVDSLPAAPTPLPEECFGCPPLEETRPLHPRPEIPQGPAPQILPQT